ncbi:MAG: hypothetical protein K0S71_564 [Clostridia bacterium]|jgi:hypothetical protein|nr:hypothetical protein [Clostridia bacterium]
MYSYYINRGHRLGDLINLTFTEKVFYSESMRYEQEKEAEKYRAMFGGGK